MKIINFIVLLAILNDYSHTFEIIKRKTYNIYDNSGNEIGKKIYYFEITENFLKAINIYYFSKDKYFMVKHIGNMEKFKKSFKNKKASFSSPGDQFYSSIIRAKYFPPDCYQFLERSYKIILKSEKGQFESDIKFKDKKILSYDNYGKEIKNLDLFYYLLSLDNFYRTIFEILISENNKTFFYDFVEIIKKIKLKKKMGLNGFKIAEKQYACLDIEDILDLKCKDQ